MVRHPCWVRLSFCAKEEWRDIFPYGKLPIYRISTQKVVFDSRADPESVVAVVWTMLSDWQQEAVLAKVCLERKTTREEVLKDLLEVGLPIRRRLISCLGIKEDNYLC